MLSIEFIGDNQMKLLIQVVVIGLMLYLSILKITQVLTQDYNEYLSESECVGDLINKGIERKHIITSNGWCDINFGN